MKSSYASIFRGFELQMCLNFDAFKCRVLNRLSNKTRRERSRSRRERWIESEVEELPNPKVRRKSIQKEVQLKKFTFQDAIFLTLATWLSNLGRAGLGSGSGWKAANVLNAATAILWVYLWVWLCILIPCKLLGLQSSSASQQRDVSRH